MVVLASQWALIETSSKYELDCATEITVAAQVAFIIAGCMHVGILQSLDHGLWTGLWTQLVTTITDQLGI